MFSFVFAATVAIAVYAHAMQKLLDHDEHQFIASAALIAREGLVPYRDFPYYHLPYLSYLYAGVFLVTDRLLVSARLVAATAALGIALLVWKRARAMLLRGSDITAAVGSAAFVLALVTNPLFLYTAGRAWNHDVAILLALASALVLAAVPDSRRPVLTAVASGALLGLAIATRSTTALIAAPLLISAVVVTRASPASGRGRLPSAFVSGLALSLLPLGVLYALAPERFVYGNLTYNLVLNPLYRHEMGYDVAMSHRQKVDYLVGTVFAHPRNVALLLAYCASALAALVTRRGSDPAAETGKNATAIVVALCLPFLLVAALVPTPTWYQYYYALVPFLLVGTIANFSLIGTSRLRWLAGIATLPMLLGALTGARYYAPVLFLSPLAEWTAFRVHRTGQEIAVAAGAARVLTLGPTYALEGGLRIYPELATGAFEWRTAALVEAVTRTKLGLLGPAELARLDNEREFVALLTGVERDPAENLEASLLEHVQKGRWTPKTVGDDLTLWLRPRR